MDKIRMSPLDTPGITGRRCQNCQALLVDEAGPHCRSCAVRRRGVLQISGTLDLYRRLDEQAATIERLEAENAVLRQRFETVDALCAQMAKAVSE